MKKIIVLTLILVCLLSLSACKQEYILHLGMNAEIVEIAAAGQVVYVADTGAEEIFGEKCAISCEKLIEGENIIYVDYDTHEVSGIQFSDLAVGDKVTVNAYESQLSSAAQGSLEAEQIQLATQRLDIDQEK